MQPELFVAYVPLLAAVVASFAISSIVGMLVARLWATPRALGDLPDEPGPRSSWPDPARETLTRR